jgi:hypothetical protein
VVGARRGFSVAADDVHLFAGPLPGRRIP